MTDPRDPHPLDFWADMTRAEKATAITLAVIFVVFGVLGALVDHGAPPARRLDAECVSKEIERVHSVCAIHEETPK